MPEKEHNEATILGLLKNNLKGNSAIIVNSRQKLEHFTLNLSKNLKNLKIVSQLTGSIGKIGEKFKEDPENSILIVTPYVWGKFKDAHLINTLFIHKIPFDPPSIPYIMALSQNFDNPFEQLQIPRAAFALKALINKLGQETPKTAIILDPRLVSKSYGKSIKEHLDTLVKTQTITSANL